MSRFTLHFWIQYRYAFLSFFLINQMMFLFVLVWDEFGGIWRTPFLPAKFLAGMAKGVLFCQEKIHIQILESQFSRGLFPHSPLYVPPWNGLNPTELPSSSHRGNLTQQHQCLVFLKEIISNATLWCQWTPFHLPQMRRGFCQVQNPSGSCQFRI